MIPLADPKLSYIRHRKEIESAIRRVLDSGRYINAGEVLSFEKAFSSYVGVAHGIGVGSGTEAIHLLLRAFGIGEGDEVITASHTAVATVAAIELSGASPVLVDIEPDFFTIDPNAVEAAISERTKALIAVHLYGQPADLSRLKEICGRHRVRLIEDCAQAHGAEYEGKKVGSFGDAACFSFYPTKNLGALGDGGMIVTDDDELAERCRLLREYGWKNRYVSEARGLNSRLDELQAAILNVKLNHLEKENKARQEIALYYQDTLHSLPVGLPKRREEGTHVFHLYVICTANRKMLMDYLRDHEILTGIHYPVPIHLQPAYKGRVKSLGMDHTERIADEILSLPCYPGLSSENGQRITGAIRRWCLDGSG